MQLDDLIREMRLVEQRHQVDERAGRVDSSSSDKTNWNQVIAYFKGKATGLLSGLEFCNKSHH